jgi:hypothetical protein
MNQQPKNQKPKISRYQVMASMTPEELLSEGYANYDDFYDPQDEKEKKAIALYEKKMLETPWTDDGEEF